MYSLMLVEDEPIVLEGMLKIIDFQALGFEVVRACSNGAEALDAYRTFKPDVVVTDICMDIMDGLEFIEEVSKEHSGTKFVIVSGHQDFKFFKKALSLKVTDYILKPVTAKEFRELLCNISKELDHKQQERQGNQFQEFIEVEKNMFFNRFMHIKMDEEEIRAKMDAFSLPDVRGSYQVAIFKMMHMAKAAKEQGLSSADSLLNKMYVDICELVDATLEQYVFIEPQGNVVLIGKGKNTEQLVESFKFITKQISHRFTRSSSSWIECYIGLDVNTFLELPKSYKSANRLNICGVLDNGTGIYIAEEILFNRASHKLDYTEDMEQWVRSIIFGDAKSGDILEAIFEKFNQASYLLTDLRRSVVHMQDYLLKELKYLGRVQEKPIYKNIDQLEEADIKKALREVTKSLTSHIGNNTNGRDNYVAIKAVAYIEKNYYDPNIDLTKVCEALNVSVSYFSTVFKKHTAMTFVKYLNDYRIDKAKYFLAYTNDSITDISEQVGFMDVHYFGIVFRKYTQTTPKKYRMSL